MGLRFDLLSARGEFPLCSLSPYGIVPRGTAVTPDRDRLRIYACQNGWQVTLESWNNGEQRWEDGMSWVYQDLAVMLTIIQEHLSAQVEQT